MRSGYVGIDLAIAKGKRLPVVIATFIEGRLTPLPLRRAPVKPPRGYGNPCAVNDHANRAFAREATTYIAALCNHFEVQPIRIGIDAPSAPRNGGLSRRAAEAAMDRSGISCFTTPTEEKFASIRSRVRRHLDSGGQPSRLPNANQLWMLTGFALYQALESLAPCIEVYPQATVQVLGIADRHKSRGGAADAQLAVAAQYTGWPGNARDEPALAEIGFGSRHDLVDAYLACWVAALDEGDRQALGVPPYDVIWTPRLNKPTHHAHAAQSKTQSLRSRSQRSHPLSRLCPACGKKQFKRWPLGWDAHAAFTCPVLDAKSPQSRKEEFKRLYGHLFTKANGRKN